MGTPATGVAAPPCTGRRVQPATLGSSAVVATAHLLALFALGACGVETRDHGGHPGSAGPTEAGTSGGADDGAVASLRALPYVQWNDATDPLLRGVVRHDRARAWQGLNLYTNDSDEAYLMDMDGRRVHRWRIPETRKQHCEHAELLASGDLAVICVDDALFVLDRHSNVLYEHRQGVHHDVAPLGDGTLWSWGPGILDGPHMPTLLDNGHLLIFDNGTERGWSRVIELDPVTLEIEWEYRGDPPEAFHSKWRGSNQRLPNGNTLVCESDKGRIFEVTPEGEIVWEFWSTETRETRGNRTQRKRVYRFTRLEAEHLPGWMATKAQPPSGAPARP